jgi:hypothetical protein
MTTQLAQKSSESTAARGREERPASQHESGDDILREVRQANQKFRDFLVSSSAKGLKRRSR